MNFLLYYTYDNMMPLSTENWSVGRPAMFQARIFTWSPSVAIREKSSEQGIPRSFTLWIQAAIWSYWGWEQWRIKHYEYIKRSMSLAHIAFLFSPPSNINNVLHIYKSYGSFVASNINVDEWKTVGGVWDTTFIQTVQLPNRLLTPAFI